MAIEDEFKKEDEIEPGEGVGIEPAGEQLDPENRDEESGEYEYDDVPGEGAPEIFLMGLTKKQFFAVVGGGVALLILLMMGLFAMSGGGDQSGHAFRQPSNTQTGQTSEGWGGNPSPASQDAQGAGAGAISAITPPAAVVQPAPTMSSALAGLQNDIAINGKALIDMHASLMMQQRRLGALEASVKNVMVVQAQAQAEAEPGASVAANGKALKKIQSQLVSITRGLKKLSARMEKTEEQVKLLESRPILPGWQLVAVTHRGAVLSGPGQAVKVLKPGETVFGIKIISLRPKKGEIVTNLGVMRVSD